MSTPTVNAPPARNLTSELMQTYRGQAQTAGPYYNLESQYQPLYGQLNLSNMAQNLFGYNPAQPQGPQTPGYHPGTLQLGAAANTFQRGADIADVARYGPSATSAFLAANPFLAGGLTNLYGRTQDSPILQMLNQNAQTALQSQGQLSPQEGRAADQQSREALAARGLLTSAPSAVSEVLNRDALVRQRQAAAQQFASGVQGLNQNQADLVGRAAQIFSTTLSDPFQSILGRPSGAGGGGAGGGYPQQIGTGARLFDPTNAYASDLYNTNYNAAAAANIANANNQAATQSGLIKAGGSVLSAATPYILDWATSDERIKKAIRGTREKTRAGIPIKTFEYKTDPQKRKFRGVMAQDVEKVIPMAVRTDPLTGLKSVNYRMADAPFDFIGGGLEKGGVTMPYNPGISYIGPQLWADALGSIGENLAKGIDRSEEIRKQNALNDPIMQHALETGRITQDEYNKYHEANFSTKASMANGVIANVHDDWQRQMFAKQEQDKQMQRALELQIAHMAHDPSENAFQPIYGPPPDQGDAAYQERGLGGMTPTGQPLPTQGPQVGVYGEKGTPYFYPWREVTNPDGTKVGGDIKVDRDSLKGSAIVTKEGSNQFQVIPETVGGGSVGSVVTGENVPPNTLIAGPKGGVIKLSDKARRALDAAAMPTPAPTPTPFGANLYSLQHPINAFLGATPTPSPLPAALGAPPGAVTAGPLPAPAQTPVPTVVAPPTVSDKIKVLDPQGNPYLIPAGRWPDYQNAGWTQAPGG